VRACIVQGEPQALSEELRPSSHLRREMFGGCEHHGAKGDLVVIDGENEHLAWAKYGDDAVDAHLLGKGHQRLDTPPNRLSHVVVRREVHCVREGVARHGDQLSGLVHDHGARAGPGVLHEEVQGLVAQGVEFQVSREGVVEGTQGVLRLE